MGWYKVPAKSEQGPCNDLRKKHRPLLHASTDGTQLAFASGRWSDGRQHSNCMTAGLAVLLSSVQAVADVNSFALHVHCAALHVCGMANARDSAKCSLSSRIDTISAPTVCHSCGISL